MSQSVSKAASQPVTQQVSESINKSVTGWLSDVSQLFGQSGIQQVSHSVSL